MSSISFPSFPAMAAFLSRAAGNAFSPVGAAVAAGAAVVGGVAYYLARTTANNPDAENVAQANNDDSQLPENVTTDNQTETAASLFARVTGSIKGWATNFVGFLSGLVTASFRANTTGNPSSAGTQGNEGDEQPQLNGPQGNEGDEQPQLNGPQGNEGDEQPQLNGPQGNEGDEQPQLNGPQGNEGDDKQPHAPHHSGKVRKSKK